VAPSISRLLTTAPCAEWSLPRAHARAADRTTASRLVELTRSAIRSWRHLTGLDNPVDEPKSVNDERKVVLVSEFVPSH
jgi:hypothetical protein